VSQPHPIGQYLIRTEPYYRPTGDEVELYRAAYMVRMPMMLKGPTGCGKTRFVEYMAWHLGRPLITIACHEDMTASDLVGRHLLDASGTRSLSPCVATRDPALPSEKSGPIPTFPPNSHLCSHRIPTCWSWRELSGTKSGWFAAGQTTSTMKASRFR
jgi:hypothetical protein